MSKKKGLSLYVFIFLTVVPLILSSFLTILVIQNENTIAHFGFSKWVFITLICSLSSALAFSPPTFLALVFGYFLGWQAIIPVFSLNIIAIFLINIFAKYLNTKELLAYFNKTPSILSILNNLHKEELKLIFFTKLSPILPFSLSNLIFSLAGASLKNILWGGFLGMIPRTLLAIWTGLQAKEIKYLLENPNESNTNKFVLITLIIGSVIGFYLILKRLIKNTISD